MVCPEAMLALAAEKIASFSTIDSYQQKEPARLASDQAFELVNRLKVRIKVKIQLRLGQGLLRVLHRAGSMIRKSIGGGNIVPSYGELFQNPNIIIKTALAELEAIDRAT